MKVLALAAAAAVGLTSLLAQGGTLRAAEIKVLASGGLAAVFKELGPQFEKQSGHKLALKLEQTGAIKRMVEGGEAFDLVIAGPEAIDDLIKGGKVVAASRANIARTGIGLVVKAGAPKPDIKSTDAFKKTLLAAKSITYPKEGASAAHLAKVFDKLGIADQLKSKIRPEPVTGRTAIAVAQGEAEIGIAVVSTILGAALQVIKAKGMEPGTS